MSSFFVCVSLPLLFTYYVEWEIEYLNFHSVSSGNLTPFPQKAEENYNGNDKIFFTTGVFCSFFFHFACLSTFFFSAL
jgi:hypothetical protein